MPVTDTYQAGRFFVRGWQGNPELYATPLLNSPRGNRDHGSAFCRRFHPRRPGHHSQRIHRLHLECFCHTRPALVVLRYFWTDESFSLPSHRSGADSDPNGIEDDYNGLLQSSDPGSC